MRPEAWLLARHRCAVPRALGVHGMLGDASYYVKMAAGLARYQRSPRQADPVAAVREQMRHRDARFLQLARGVLEQPNHVYSKLFVLAGCSYGDLEAGVRGEGLRGTLARLAAAGVYITHEEFTGRSEMVRGGRHIAWAVGELDNPIGRGRNMQATSGSTGARVTVGLSNAGVLYREGHETLEIENMGLRRRARMLLGAILPSAWTIRRQVAWGRLGVPVDRWFAPGFAGRPYRWLTNAMVSELKLLGVPARFPEYLPPNDFAPAARALARFRADGRPGYVRTMVSMATRAASAAREHGLDIRDTVFSVSGETLTPAKRALIESAGAIAAPFYGATEFGVFGYACSRMTDDSVHLFEDSLLLVSHRLPDRPWASLFVTEQLPWGPRILINVGIDDCATIEPAHCDCEYQRLGFTNRAHDIFSYGKVTAQGVTMTASDLVDLIENTLPARFGGAAGDYQLAEVDGDLQSEMLLRISPRTGVTDPQAVRDFVMERLGNVVGGSLSRRLWSFSGAMKASLEEPEMTATGKVHPLRLRRS